MLQTAGLSHGSDDHVEMAVPSPVGDIKMVSPISTSMLNTLTLKTVLFLCGGWGGAGFSGSCSGLCTYPLVPKAQF